MIIIALAWLAVAAPAAAETPLVAVRTVSEVRVLNAATIGDFTPQFAKLRAQGHEIEIMRCEFSNWSMHTVIVRLTKLPADRPSEAITEGLLGVAFKPRLKELAAQNREVDIKCFEDKGLRFGEHAIIQHRPLR